ncbi:glycosyltransferase family 4 protein [Vibrio sp. B1Z05]|uniref:glycosyltransferase family 4 protein n=1 Tax=Vibrio sp. B1Z05 TaxID=2654980 RepID=UPI001562B930
MKLVVSDGLGSEYKDGIHIVDIGKRPKNRIVRTLSASIRMLLPTLKNKGDVYHAHDPELIPLCLLLRMIGKKVIYDSHEDLPRQILSKAYLPSIVRRIISRTIEVFESVYLRFMSGVITATPIIKNKLLKVNSTIIDINNYPRLEELDFSCSVDFKTSNSLIYIGTINAVRGVDSMVQAMELVKNKDAVLTLGGELNDLEFINEISSFEGWNRVDAKGWLSRSNVVSHLEASCIGMVLLKPTPAYVESLPVKMFEYMAAGIPVIYSNFPYWIDIFERFDCGVTADPDDVNSIALRIDELLSDKELCEKLGNNGKKAVREKFNWSTEEEKLLSFYKDIMG